MSGAVLGGLPLSGRDEYGAIWSTQSVTGWHGSPKPTLTVTQKPRAPGGWPSETFLNPRPIALTGTVMASDPDVLEDALDRLNAAASLTPCALQIGGRTAAVYRQDEVLINRATNAKVASWSVQLVAPDPRKYGDPIVQSTALPSSTGGLLVPYTVPYTIDETTVTGQIGIDNPGNIASPVTMRVDGPATGPIISHSASGLFLVFSSSYVLSAGNWLDIDMGRRTVLENGQSSRNGYITSRGWFDLDPGDNTIGFSAAVYDPDSLLTMTATPAYQ